MDTIFGSIGSIFFGNNQSETPPAPQSGSPAFGLGRNVQPHQSDALATPPGTRQCDSRPRPGKRILDDEFCDALTPEQWNRKYRKVTLAGNSDQLMQWVIFNDKSNSENITIDTPPLRKSELANLEDILCKLKEHYPENTPTVHMVYEIFHPEILNDQQKKHIHQFFHRLSKEHHGLRTIDFSEIKDKISYGKLISQIRETIIEKEKTGLIKKIHLFQEFGSLLGANVTEFNYRYGSDKPLMWANMVRKNPWLSSFNGELLINAYDQNDPFQQKMFNAFVEQLDSMSPVDLKNVTAFNDPQPLPIGSKAVYVDLQRSALLYNPETVTGSMDSDTSLIYRDFDTEMTGAMPDITLDYGKILGVEDFVMFNQSDPCSPSSLIIENAVMGVTLPENQTLKSVLEKARVDFIKPDNPDHLKGNLNFYTNYNYVFNQLTSCNTLVRSTKSSFTHQKTGSLKKDLVQKG